MNQRFARGLQYLASYTFGKSLDYAGSPASGGGAVGGPQSVTLFEQSKGPSGFDVKHRFVLSWVWALPFGADHGLACSGLLKPILQDWQFGGIVTLSTGRPFTVFLNTGVNNGAPSWPDRIGDGRLDHPTVDLWFDPTAFRLPTLGTWGDVGRGVLDGPGLAEFDFSVFKTTPITERTSMLFRAECFNVANRANFGLPNPIVFSGNSISPSAGKITSTTTSSRQIQFGLKLMF